MAILGYVVPETSTQTTETFHALRRTSEGLLYYTKYNKDENFNNNFVINMLILNERRRITLHK